MLLVSLIDGAKKLHVNILLHLGEIGYYVLNSSYYASRLLLGRISILTKTELGRFCIEHQRISLEPIYVARTLLKISDIVLHLSSQFFVRIERVIYIIARDHSFSTYAKFSEKLTFIIPWYTLVRVRIRG